MTDVYNLTWICPLPPTSQLVCAAPEETNTYVVHKQVPAVILYPSLMTPCVYKEDANDPWIELLLASEEAKLTPALVNRHLKVCAGLNAEKKYHIEALFSGWHENIEVEATSPDGQGILRTHKHFAGTIHPLIRDRLKQKGLSKFYRVRLHFYALLNARDAHAKIKRAAQEAACSPEPRVLADEMVTSALKRLHKLAGYQELPQHGCYAFPMGSDGPRVSGPLDPNEPIQAYHPVYLLDEKVPEHLNFGHVTDVHVNGRLDLLRGSPARVIPYDSAKDASPRAGDLVRPTNRSLLSVLTALAKDDDAHGLLVGGDLIDHQLNAYAKNGPPTTMRGVWNAVDLEEQKTRYAPGLDMVAFYGMVINFCRSAPKPVFGVSGNHDCYLAPFGVSPRAFEMVRANEGIPADVNLTFYEAALAFGPSWDECDIPLLPDAKPRSSFKAEWMEWYYSVFSPFENVRVELPKQQLVCLGWGASEDMFLGGQGFSHLPRADDAVSPVQLSLLREAVAKSADLSVIMLSHFTVVSFDDSIPLLRGSTPSTGTLRVSEDEYVMGTFESQRDAFIELLGQRQISCVLTGHSHRRALYFLGDRPDLDRDGKPEYYSRPVTIHDPDGFDLRSVSNAHRMPVIVVSDSGGPYPRYNKYGEFGGWGSDKPSGSVVMFDSRGRVEKVKVVRAEGGNEPRIAVAMDYFDLLKGSAWAAGHVETELFFISDEEEMLRKRELRPDEVFYKLKVGLHPDLVKAKLRVKSVTLYGPDKLGLGPLVLVTNGQSMIELRGKQNQKFFRWIQQSQEPDRFASVLLEWTGNSTVASKYNSNDPWNFEVKVEAWNDSTQTKRYFLRRPLRSTGGFRFFPELPDFDWRVKTST